VARAVLAVHGDLRRVTRRAPLQLSRATLDGWRDGRHQLAIAAGVTDGRQARGISSRSSL
jgi:hypothetical protein